MFYNGGERYIRKVIIWVESFVPDEDKKQPAKGEAAENDDKRAPGMENRVLEYKRNKQEIGNLPLLG